MKSVRNAIFEYSFNTYDIRNFFNKEIDYQLREKFLRAQFRNQFGNRFAMFEQYNLMVIIDLKEIFE